MFLQFLTEEFFRANPNLSAHSKKTLISAQENNPITPLCSKHKQNPVVLCRGEPYLAAPTSCAEILYSPLEKSVLLFFLLHGKEEEEGYS